MKDNEPVALCSMERWRPGMQVYVMDGCPACELVAERMADGPTPEQRKRWVEILRQQADEEARNVGTKSWMSRAAELRDAADYLEGGGR